jgi:hypothetical protein
MSTYSSLPSGTPKRPSVAFIVSICVVAVLLVVGGIAFAIHSVVESGITKGPDNLFGDQHLKTAVALIELHKVRYGKYPGSLSDLKFTGQWDQLALQNVRYYPNADRTAYFIEVERGWVGKPDLKMPDEFWRGTGYTTSLKP